MRSLKETFSLYFHGLKAAVAPTLSMPKERFAFVAAVWHYIFRLSGRLDRLVTRWQNGTLPKPRAPHPAAPQAPASHSIAPRPGRNRATPPAQPKFRLPGGHMWLLRSIQGTAFAGSQLSHLLAHDPQMQAFLEAAPQARRLINPLCRMFGFDIDKPTGVPVVKLTTVAQPKPEPEPEPKPEPEPAAAHPQEPPGTVAGAAPSASAAPNPPAVFSSA